MSTKRLLIVDHSSWGEADDVGRMTEVDNVGGVCADREGMRLCNERSIECWRGGQSAAEVCHAVGDQKL